MAVDNPVNDDGEEWQYIEEKISPLDFPFARFSIEKFLEWLHFEKGIHLCYSKGDGEYEWSEQTIPRILDAYFSRKELQ